MAAAVTGRYPVVAGRPDAPIEVKPPEDGVRLDGLVDLPSDVGLATARDALCSLALRAR